MNQPIHEAARGGKFWRLKKLVQDGADVEARNQNGSTPLISASARGQWDEMEYLVEEAGANVEARNNDGGTPLAFASAGGHLRLVEYLLEKAGAILEAKNHRGETPLYLACHKGHLDVVAYLVKTGANVEARDETGATPLAACCYGGHLQVVVYMVEEAWANMEAKDNYGKTALDCARKKNRFKVVNYLEQSPGRLMVKQLEGKQKTWIGAKEAKNATKCSTRVALDNAISTLKQKIASLDTALTAKELERRRVYELDVIKLQSYQDRMPSLEQLNEWVAKLQKEILANKEDTDSAIAMAKQVAKLQPRIKMEEKATTKHGKRIKKQKDTKTPMQPPPPPSAPMEEDELAVQPLPPSAPTEADVASAAHEKPPQQDIPIAEAVVVSNSPPAPNGGCCVLL